jgi:hypothetical protein
MTRLVARVAIGSAVIALLAVLALACGDKNEKPPLTPDTEHTDEAGAPPPANPAPATPPGK